MASGYKVFWTETALNELEEVEAYLIEHWIDKELKKLFKHLELTTKLISENPKIFSESDKKNGVRRAVILKLNSLYYWIIKNTI
jgi:plasmid stabilization system protein ParE